MSSISFLSVSSETALNALFSHSFACGSQFMHSICYAASMLPMLAMPSFLFLGAHHLGVCEIRHKIQIDVETRHHLQGILTVFNHCNSMSVINLITTQLTSEINLENKEELTSRHLMDYKLLRNLTCE